ncbi:MAG TPA: phage tail sheath subtilisin-like domain-containing protein, partial [Bryobacteraceae bacterium]|nr:phage tail sheath subtilisin-like domain-containing protein [Bryobacteraceae bacterium]
MPELLHPGVYVQEIPSGVRPIQGVSTSTAAFIGVTDKGPLPGNFLPTGRVAQPVLVTSFTDYQRQFGGFRRDSFLTYAVKAFYDNGGRRAYIVRVANGAALASFGPGSPPLSPPGGTLPISAANEGLWGNNIWIAVTASSDRDPNNFKLNVLFGSTAAEASRNVVEAYDNVTVMSANPADPIPANYVGALVNSRSEYIAFSPTTPLTTLPAPFAPRRLTGGSDGAPVTPTDYTGAVSVDGIRTGTGLRALDKITDVNLIAIPGQGDVGTINAGMAYCKNIRQLQDVFYIGDIGSVTSVDAARLDNAATDVLRVSDARDFATVGAPPGTQLDKSAGDYGAIYYPWVLTNDPIGTGNNPRILVPPSGYVTGIYARTDNSRGVFKAPAGIEAGLAGAIAPATAVSDFEQDSLNPVQVNAIRSVPGSGLVVWGTRTI